MPEQNPFIGRDDELSQIKDLMDDWEKPHLLFVQGDGGIGKTRLLQETYSRFAQPSDSRLLFTPIFDFDDRKLQLPKNLEFEISQKLGRDVVKSYLNSLQDLRKMETGEFSQSAIDNQKKQVRLAFLDSCQQVALNQRIVLLFDTVDAFDNEKKWAEIWDFLKELYLKTANLFLVFAGRNVEELWKSVQGSLLKNVHLINLASLGEDESQEYLQQRQNQLHISLEPELGKKILILSQGRPILMDLATHWLAHERPDKWLVDSSVEELLLLSEQEKKDFEKNLVLQISQVRTQLDRLILLLSRVYPLDVNAISELLKISIERSHALLDEANKYVFVKILPQGRIALHDEMRRMVHQYVWDEIDPTKERRKRDSKWAAKYLANNIREVSERIEQLESLEKTAKETDDAQAELSAFVERESLEHELWDMKEQRLYHVMYSDAQQGLDVFMKLFDEATLAYEFSSRDELLDLVDKYLDKFSPEQKNEIGIRRVKYFLDKGDYLQAKKLTQEILQRENITIEQKIDMLIQLGNLDIRLGELDNSIVTFEEAVQLSKTHDLDHWLARALNALGWAYRNQGNYKKALSNYLEAYFLSYHLGDHKRTAWLLNNMGYLNAFRGNRQKALDNCWSALEIWGEIDFGRGIGATHSTLGEIYRRFDQLEEAFFHYNKALDIFSDANDIEWMSTVRCGRGAAFLAEGNLEKGMEDLQWALDNGPENLKPRALHYQAQFYMLSRDWLAAESCLEESRKVSSRTGDRQYNFRSFADLIDITWETGKFSQWKKYKDELDILCKQEFGEEVYRLKGSSLRKIGDLAICHGDYKEALTSYQKGFSLIGKYEVHSPYTVREQLKITSMRINQVCPIETIRDLGKDLEEYWKNTEELLQEYPEALLTFDRWKQEKGESA